MKTKLFFAVLIFMTIFEGCTSVQAAENNEIWLILDDLSGSMGEGKGAPQQRNIDELQRIIRSAGKNTTIMVLGFGKRADVQLLKVEMPTIAGPQGKNLIATKEAAIKKLNENLSAKIKTIDRSKSGIHGALMRASRILAEYEGAVGKKLVILSDMLENESFNLSFSSLRKAGSAEELFKTLNNKRLDFPDLKGVELHCYSSFADEKNIKTAEIETALKELKTFWTKYFQKTGVALKSYKTSMY